MQCLANPRYINCAWSAQPRPRLQHRSRRRAADLAQHQLLSDPALVAYLAYLQYWCRPEYARFLTYPTCLAALELLQSAEFRATIAAPEAAEFVWRTQFHQWQWKGGAEMYPAQAEAWRGVAAPAAGAEKEPPPPHDEPDAMAT